MVEAFNQVGGPPALVKLLVASSLAEHYDFQVLSYAFSGFNPPAISKLRHELIALQPDLVHVHGLKADAFHAVVAARLARVSRVLVTVHGSSIDGVARRKGSVAKCRRWIVSRILEPLTLRWADAVYCVCDAMKNRRHIQCHAGPRLRETIHNGIPPGKPPGSAATLRALFGFTQKDLVLIYTGRISCDKGLETLSAALKQILNQVDPPRSLKLLLVGDGPDFERLNTSFQQLIESGYVVMTGRRDDIAGLNAMADIFVFPSFSENLPFSLLEAMDAALPIISTSVGGIPELVVHGQTGLLVPPHDASALAQAILRLASNPQLREGLGKAGRARLLNHFSSQETCLKTGLLYESLLLT
jgi:glycosyltransferase involved in cell wall biosynthesis